MPQTLYPQGRTPAPTGQEAGWVWMQWKGEKIPAPDRNQTLVIQMEKDMK